jgi:hypothetical protein
MDWRRRASDDVNKPGAPPGQESDTELAGEKEKKRKSPFRRLVRGNIQDEIHGERVRETVGGTTRGRRPRITSLE